MERKLSDKELVFAVILSYYIYDEMTPQIFDDLKTLKIENLRKQLLETDKEEYCKAVMKAKEYLKRLDIELVEKECGV